MSPTILNLRDSLVEHFLKAEITCNYITKTVMQRFTMHASKMGAILGNTPFDWEKMIYIAIPV